MYGPRKSGLSGPYHGESGAFFTVRRATAPRAFLELLFTADRERAWPMKVEVVAAIFQLYLDDVETARGICSYIFKKVKLHHF